MSPWPTQGHAMQAAVQAARAARGPRTVRIGALARAATLSLPPARARGLVIWVAAAAPQGAAAAPLPDFVRVLAEHRLATLLLDLAPARQDAGNAGDAGDVADVDTCPPPGEDLAQIETVAIEALDWAAGFDELAGLRAGLCAGDIAAAAMLLATTRRPARVAAVVARSGRPDLAGAALARVAAPTLLIVGGNDAATLALNRTALLSLDCEKRLEVVPGAGRCFKEPGARAAMVHLAATWLSDRLADPLGGSALRH